MKQIRKVKTITTEPTFGVVDSLNSTSTTDSLSANMGRELNEKINNLELTGSGSSLDIYSTEEQIIGTWVDNKTLYRKVIQIGAVSTSEVRISTGISNIDQVIDLKGGGTMIAGQFLKWGFENAGGFCSCYYDKNINSVVAIVSTTNYNLKQAYAILEYTKTTD